VDGLTASVVASESAQIAAKVERANDVSHSIRSGFFTLIRSEISQQMVALKSRIESLMLKLRDMRDACKRIHTNMQSDYARISERYVKIFDELDRETHKRVNSIDGGTVRARSEIVPRLAATTTSRLCTEATVSASESGQAQTKLIASSVRAQSQSLLLQAAIYLQQEKQLGNTLRAMLYDHSVNEREQIAIPLLMVEVEEGTGRSCQQHLPPCDGALSHCLVQRTQSPSPFESQDCRWAPWTAEARARVDRYFADSLEGYASEDAAHAARVRRTIQQLWTRCTPLSLVS
jgi:hypothetical protein